MPWKVGERDIYTLTHLENKNSMNFLNASFSLYLSLSNKKETKSTAYFYQADTRRRRKNIDKT